MKKTFIFLSMAASVIAAVSCNKELEGPSLAEGITRTVTLTESEATKTSVENNFGFTGNEAVAVYYKAQGESTFNSIVASTSFSSSDNSCTFSFTHDAIAGAVAYDYFYLLPYNSYCKLNGAKTAASTRINCVQFPSAGSYDPLFDIVIGRPSLGVDAATSALVSEYSRLTTPLKVTLKGLDSVLEGEKVNQVNIKFAAAASSMDNALVGMEYLNLEEGKINSISAKSASNGITADYVNGLAHSGTLDCWFMVNPVTLAAGDAVVTVVGDSKTISRTITLPELAILKNKVNKISFDMAGAGSSSENSITTTLVNTSGKFPTTSSTGAALGWTFTNMNNPRSEAGHSTCCQFKNSTSTAVGGSVTIPAPEAGVSYKKIQLSMHTTTGSSESAAGSYILFSFKAGDTEFASVSLNHSYDETKNGGVATVTIPAEYADQAITITKGTDSGVGTVSRITLFTDGGSSAPTVDTNDYWDIYSKGGDICFGSVTINSASGLNAEVIYADSYSTVTLARQAMQKAGIHFLDLTHNSDGSVAAEPICLLSDNIQPVANCYIIGRYKNAQSELDLGNNTKAVYFQKAAGGNVGFKNIKLTTGTPTNVFAVSTGGTTDVLKVIIEDCTITTNKNLFGYQSTGSYSYVVNEIEFNNNIVLIGDVTDNRKLFPLPSATGTTQLAYSNIRKLSIENNIFYTAADLTTGKRLQIVDYGGSTGCNLPTTNLEIIFKNNTSYNVYADGQISVRAYQAKSAVIDGNLFYQDLTKSYVIKNMYAFGLYAHLDGTTATDASYQATEEAAYVFSNNFAHSYGTASFTGWSWLYKNGQPVYYANQSNKTALNAATKPFTTEDTTNGYFPVNSSVVTNGAGASYETKLWKNWTSLGE